MALRWVLITDLEDADPTTAFQPQALLRTDCGAAAAQFVAWFVLRWQLEVPTFADTLAFVRQHLWPVDI